MDRAKSQRDGPRDARPDSSSARAAAPRAPAVLIDSAASFDAELSRPASAAGSSLRRRSGSGGAELAAAERARNRTAMQAALAEGSSSGAAHVSALAAALEAAVHASCTPVLTVLAALRCNASLRAALLSGWLDPADAAVMTGRALMTSDFL